MKKLLTLFATIGLGACNMGQQTTQDTGYYPTPTVDYVQGLDVYSAPHKDSFLNQLAMNYRSYAIYNARTSGFPDIGEQFAQKAVAAFSGETPMPESVANWGISDETLAYDLNSAATRLDNTLKNDAAQVNPELTAEAQAKFDCWLSASASQQWDTANECESRFAKAIDALESNCGSAKIVSKAKTSDLETSVTETTHSVKSETYYPETGDMRAMRGGARPRESIVVVNNINIPQNLIQPVPVPAAAAAQPVIFNQNIYGSGDKARIENCGPDGCVNNQPESVEETPQLQDELVSRDEFINMMMALRSELSAINERLDNMPQPSGDKTILKVQQIPLEPKQHVMEEIFEIRFDFNKAKIKPEYQDVIKKLVETTQENKNVKISVVGHTDTVGTNNYNYALGGRRAEAVKKMLVKYGIPADQIVAVSSGKTDPKVPTGDQVKNPENRRVRVVKEVHYTAPVEQPKTVISIQKNGKPVPLDESGTTEINSDDDMGNNNNPTPLDAPSDEQPVDSQMMNY